MTLSNIHPRRKSSPENIQNAVWLYHQFNLSHSDIEGLMAEQGITSAVGRKQRVAFLAVDRDL